MLAGIPKEPKKYAPMKGVYKDNVSPDDYIIDDTDPLLTYIYNPECEGRYSTVIYLMHENGVIDDAQYEEAKNTDLRTKLHPGKAEDNNITSYFADMVKDDVVDDLVKTYGYTKEDAEKMLFNNGLTIHSTIDLDMQRTLESNYALNNFTTYFGEASYKAVRSFQKDNGLSADGIAGQSTLAKLAEVSQLDLSLFTQNIYKKGVTADEVSSLKSTLYDLGYFRSNDNFPRVTVKIDKEGNIISSKSRKILLYPLSKMVNDNQQLVIPSSDYEFNENGDLVLYKNKRLNFYSHYKDDQLSYIQIVIEKTYDYDKESNTHVKGAGTYNISGLYTYEGHEVTVPNDYKSFDDNKNLVVSKSFLTAEPDFFKVDSENNLVVDSKNYLISDTGIIQPQSAMVIIDYHTGELKAIVGGRNITGQKIYNRATNPRQPGSSIKPLSVFTPAIDSRQYTAASVIDDIPVYLGGNPNVRWPYNWYEHSSKYSKYWGLVTLRESLQWSINVSAAIIVNDLGVDKSIEYLEKFGITSLVKEGSSNDYNLSAMALGGMTRGVSPLEMTAAYGAIANKGVLNETITYSTVENRSGEVILENDQKKNYVVDEDVAYIVEDMMKSVVSSGLATSAKLSANNDVIPVAGKTGTTSDKMDAWFVGFTPYYVGGVWFGNDINIPLDQGSKVSSQFWKTVMAEIHAGKDPKSFERPAGIVSATVDSKSGKLPTEYSYMDPRNTVHSEIFLSGTVPTEQDDVHVAGAICLESGKLATPFCPTTLVENRVFIKRPVPYIPEDHLDSAGNPILPGDWIYELPTEDCDIHTGKTLDIGVYDYSGYEGAVPAVSFPDGSRIVQVPFNIELTDGQKILLPVSTKILADNTIIYPDGSTIPAYMISYIPVFDLDSYSDHNKPNADDAMDDIDDNSNLMNPNGTNNNADNNNPNNNQ